MNKEDCVFYSQQIWHHYDKQISTSSLSVDKFNKKDDKSITPPKIKISIYHKGASNYMSLSIQNVFELLQKFKKVETRLSAIAKELEVDIHKQYNTKITNQKNLFITIMSRVEYGGMCARMVISDKDSDYLDSEVCYIPIFDFLSLIVIFNQFKNNYLQICDSATTLISLDMLHQRLQSMESKLASYYSETVSRNYPPALINQSNPPEILNGISLVETTVTEEPVVDDLNLYGDMSTFIKDNVAKADIGIPDFDKPVTPKNTEQAIILPKSFTEKFLNNDILNLEMYISNLINEDLPFSKFVSLVQNKLDFDPVESTSESDINGLNYIISNYLKHIVKQNIEKKVEIPTGVTPIVLDNITTNEDKISLAYDLFLYYVYYTHLRNMLKDKDYNPITNKELVCFALKVITSPMVFSLIKTINPDIMIAEVINRNRRYKESGVFSNMEKKLEEKGLKFHLGDDVIKTELSRFCKTINENWNKFTIAATFSKLNILKLSHDDIQKNKLSEEQIKKILIAEFNFKKNGKVVFSECGIKSFDDIPMEISEKFGVSKKKFDTTNLKRYIKENCSDDKSSKYCLELTNRMNESYRDLNCANVDFMMIPENILKALFLWDLNKDIKIANNYLYYLEMVNQSSLTKDMIISMMTNTSTVVDEDFTASFISSRE